MTFAKAGMQESDLAAHFAYLTTLEGSQRPAYEPVVASGCAIPIEFSVCDAQPRQSQWSGNPLHDQHCGVGEPRNGSHRRWVRA